MFGSFLNDCLCGFFAHTFKSHKRKDDVTVYNVKAYVRFVYVRRVYRNAHTARFCNVKRNSVCRSKFVCEVRCHKFSRKVAF